MASFFLEFPDFFASLGFLYRGSLSHQNAQETLNFSAVHSKTGLWALAFLAFFYFLILVPSQAICVRRLRDAGIHWSWIFLNLGPVLLYLLTGLDIFLFLWGITVISLLILMMLPGKNTFPQPVETPMGVVSEPQLEQKMAAEHEIH